MPYGTTPVEKVSLVARPDCQLSLHNADHTAEGPGSTDGTRTCTRSSQSCRHCTPPWRTMAAMLSSLSASPYNAKAALCCRLPLRDAMSSSRGGSPPACAHR